MQRRYSAPNAHLALPLRVPVRAKGLFQPYPTASAGRGGAFGGWSMVANGRGTDWVDFWFGDPLRERVRERGCGHGIAASDALGAWVVARRRNSMIRDEIWKRHPIFFAAAAGLGWGRSGILGWPGGGGKK